jgi:succinate-semialdehyde dehydrogenase / glutarate-semialdehyde dehydrogenase
VTDLPVQRPVAVQPLFIDGTWRHATGNATRVIVDPATEDPIGRVADAHRDDLDAALASAEHHAPAWRETEVSDRAAILTRAAALLADRLDTIAEALTREQGKTLAESRAEIRRAIETFAWHGAALPNVLRPRPVSSRLISPEPIGIVCAFTPWNYPAVIAARKLAAALGAGCPVIMKGAEETPSAVAAIVQALVDAGVPRGVVQLVFGDPPAIASHLLASPIVRALTFTGSTAVGKLLARDAASTLKRCVLELGGHAPVLVFADADLNAAAEAIAAYKFECAGQSCNAPSRVYVEAAAYPALLDRLTALARRIVVGPGLDPETTMGPMANARRIAAMERLMADARSLGSRVVTGGERLPRPGYFWPPTILTDVPPDAAMMTEEPFGPLLPVLSFSTFDEAIAQANRTPYGLAAYVFTRSESTADAAARALDAGSVGINQLRGVPPDAPVGGIKDSGYGYEGGAAGIEAFVHLKLVSR